MLVTMALHCAKLVCFCANVDNWCVTHARHNGTTLCEALVFFCKSRPFFIDDHPEHERDNFSIALSRNQLSVVPCSASCVAPCAASFEAPAVPTTDFFIVDVTENQTASIVSRSVSHCGCCTESTGFSRFSINSFITDFTQNQTASTISRSVLSSRIMQWTRQLLPIPICFLHR